MQQIVNFILKNKTFLFFITLFSFSVFLTIQNHAYHKSKFINSTHFIAGGIYSISNNIDQYFHLKEQNILLQEENNRLKKLLHNYNYSITNNSFLDSISFPEVYRFTPALVLKNSYASENNFLLINKGKNNNLKQDLGVISNKGIIGIVDQTSGNFSRVISILNTKSNISAQLKKTNHFGTLKWNGLQVNVVQLIDIPSKAPITKGDTIITSGRSAIFPKGVPIGVVNNFNMGHGGDFYELDILLFNDMTNIEHVYVIENLLAKEQNNILNNE